MNRRALRQAAALSVLALAISACVSRPPVESPSRPTTVQTLPRVVTPPRPTPPEKACANCPTAEKDYAPTRDEIPAGIENTPDAIPQAEPRSKYGNPDSYDALGEHYEPLKETPKGFRQHGRASWYGKKFQGQRTASGEIYDMFKMTAAHKTLPLPSYARVTNLDNGRSVVVRVNDRGPFHPGRIVDLSYAAAARLDLLHHGSAEVELEALTVTAGNNAFDGASARGKPRYLEVGRFSDPIDAVSLRERLAGLGFTETEFLQVTSPSGDGYDNILRLGPFTSFESLESARKKLGNQRITALPVEE